MTTKLRRGRDPEQHELVETPAVDSYTGLCGQIVGEFNPSTGEILALRIMDGIHAGGYRVPVSFSQSAVAKLPVAKIVTLTAVDLPVGNFNIEHMLGYSPMVQILDSTGADVTADFVFTFPDTANLVINNTGAAAVNDCTIQLR